MGLNEGLCLSTIIFAHQFYHIQKCFLETIAQCRGYGGDSLLRAARGKGKGFYRHIKLACFDSGFSSQ